VSVIGVYPPTDFSFPVGKAMNRNLTLRMGNCDHRRYLPELIELVRAGVMDPEEILSQRVPLTSAIEAYRAFDRRQSSWIKVELLPSVLH
jgi:threonine dehydrogenase-like Zn-dependent dehydrogenase